MLSCQKEGKSDSGIDKDEEHSLVLAQDLSNSRVSCWLKIFQTAVCSVLLRMLRDNCG